ncbi:protein translocase subunit SecD [Methylovirgula sp. 4M-Z18]|uniref:protein translocase subunit SecD n=1 Tax=Methylovirgula sp. 4M-Z18 TaxID=2293567 RepID=UPI000E2F0A37|nr:protein translocase subunit SecD [Methylovirgula sp. 4M-Z18]RFB81024.1 protein translocase subunit SecD [Methylovirgula sp. 4M-Z18]
MQRYAPWKIISIFALILAAFLLIIPSLVGKDSVTRLQSHLPSWVPARQIVLGLDLQGGAHLLLEIDRTDVLKSMVLNLRDQVRGVLTEEKVRPPAVTQITRGWQARVPDPDQRARVLSKLNALAAPTGGLAAGGGSPTYDVKDVGDGSIQVTVTDAGVNDRVRHAIAPSIEVLKRRVDALGTTEPNVQQQGDDRILVEVPGLQDTTQLKELLQGTAKMVFRLVAQPGADPSEYDVLPSTEGGTVNVEKSVMVDGEDLIDAQPSIGQDGNPVINFKFNIRGGQKFAAVTADNVGRQFAVVLDNKVITYPVIRTPILGGSGEISGHFTSESANNLAIQLRAGALPAKLSIVEERTVGPGLGEDSINAGKKAAYVGAALVVIYMLITYGIFGVFANIALAIHISFIFASFVLLGSTLTLPGIAGIVMTIGMAVDANVLIYERIREENHAGRSIIASLDAGFTRAFATIVDSNATMMVVALILLFLGSGPVKGFAWSLIFGIMTSIITAVTMTRMMIALWYAYARPKKLPI